MANSFNRYGVSSPGEIAALVSLMAYESGEFKYQVNLAGNPGQGSEFIPPPLKFFKNFANI